MATYAILTLDGRPLRRDLDERSVDREAQMIADERKQAVYIQEYRMQGRLGNDGTEIYSNMTFDGPGRLVQPRPI